MRIQLKQTEIEMAIRSSLSSQGISIDGKNVSMVFKSGRKNNGLTVEVVIEDHALKIVIQEVPEGLRSGQIPKEVMDKIMVPQVNKEVVVAPMTPEEVPDVPEPVATGSLFA